MGGQACVLYGAAEFSRDTDFAILATLDNLDRLRRALDDLQAVAIAVPPLTAAYLRRGHAVHFRCRHPDAAGMRIDVMSRMRCVDAFARLWRRRTTVELTDGTLCDLLSLPDLVLAKKTQRDRDWPMIRRLLEANYFAHRAKPSAPQVNFWLRELRTPALLVEVAGQHAGACRRLTAQRPLLALAASGRIEDLERSLAAEEAAERERDRRYWVPLRRELEQLRHEKTGS